MLLTLVVRWLAQFTGLAPIFAVLSLLFLAGLAAAVQVYGRDPLLTLAILFSYPLVFLVGRGNLYAGLAGLPVIIALLRQRPDWLGAALLAVAISVRPNLALITLAFLSWSFILRVGAVALALSLASLALAHLQWPDYSLTSFLEGLARYSAAMNGSVHGVPFGSSLLGGLVLVGAGQQVVLSVYIGLVVAAATWWLGSRLDLGERAFLLFASMVFIVPVFADYHLIVFAAPLLLTRNRIVCAACTVMLMCATYGALPIGEGTATWQAIIHPAVLLVSAALLIARARHRSPPPPGEAGEPKQAAARKGTAALSQSG
jgi:hypothetical protein